jgi:hypothetical protein
MCRYQILEVTLSEPPSGKVLAILQSPPFPEQERYLSVPVHNIRRL